MEPQPFAKEVEEFLEGDSSDLEVVQTSRILKRQEVSRRRAFLFVGIFFVVLVVLCAFLVDFRKRKAENEVLSPDILEYTAVRELRKLQNDLRELRKRKQALRKELRNPTTERVTQVQRPNCEEAKCPEVSCPELQCDAPGCPQLNCPQPDCPDSECPAASGCNPVWDDDYDTPALPDLESAANMVCSKFPKPKVAVCVAGSVRTFLHPIVWNTLRKNLIESFGGDTKTFFYLRRNDTNAANRILLKKGKPQHTYQETPNEDIMESVLKILKSSNVKFEDKDFAMNEECKIGLKPPRDRGFVGQSQNHYFCAEMIEQYEREHNFQFDYIIRTRTDLTWYLPIRPYCFWNFGETYRRWDWVYMSKRDNMMNLMKAPYDTYRSCEGGFDFHGDSEHMMYAIFNNVAKVRVTEDDQLPVMIVREDGRVNTPCNKVFIARFKDVPGHGNLCGSVSMGNDFNDIENNVEKIKLRDEEGGAVNISFFL